MGRISLIVTFSILSTLRVSAQSGGYASLEFIENKGQWDSSVRFRADLSAGNLFMQRTGFTVLLRDTGDLRRIGQLLHGDADAQAKWGGWPGRAANASGAAGATKAPAAAGGKAVASGGADAPPVSRYPVQGGGRTGGAGDPFLLHSFSYRVTFDHAGDHTEIVPDKPLDSYNNYFKGDKKRWATGCRIYQGILYRNMYDGIDVRYYSDRGFVKYDIIVHPGADPGKIVLKYDGPEKLTVRRNKLYVQTSVATVTGLEPHSYQVGEGGRTEVACEYTLLGDNRIGFRVKNYSHDETLVIDPVEVFCSFSGSRSDNWGYTATYDNAGNFYMGGIVLDETNQNPSGPGGGGFLYSPGAFQTSFQGGDGSEGDGYDYDVAILKLSSNGSKRVYATYLGGNGDEQPHSMVVDDQGNLVVTGRTSSANFPPNSPGTLYGNGGGFDLFIVKFNATGTALIGSKRIGGSGDDGVNYRPKYLVNSNSLPGAQDLRLNYGDDGRSEVILDAAGNIYVAACSQSTDFPVTPGVFQQSSGGGQDGVLIKTSPNLGTILFSSYLGGKNSDAAFVLSLDPLDNSIWVGGGTESADFPGTAKAPVISANNNGGIDGFVAVVSNDGSQLLKSSYFGTRLTDMIYGLEFDKNGFPYIMGTTDGAIPVVNSPFNAGGNQANGKQFITKLKQDLSGIVYSANFGPAGSAHPQLSPTAFLVDRCENVYVAGWGGGPDSTDHYANSSTFGLVTTTGAFKPATDGEDFYFFVLQKNAASQLFGSFFGQQNGHFGDHVDGGTSRFDKQGVIYEAVCANCYGGAQFPTTPGSWATQNGTGSGACNEAAVKIAFNFSGVAAGLKLVTHGRGDSVGCVPLAVDFSDTVHNARTYVWNFGDGTVVGNSSPTMTHTYVNTGTYVVTLVAIDSNTCNIADTVMRTIAVKDNPAALDFDFSKLAPCTSMSYLFTNQSSAPPGLPFDATAFTWSFGDGSTEANVPFGDRPSHAYASPGPYNVTLTLNDTAYCNYPLDTVRLLYVAQNVLARFSTPAIGCVPDSAQFANTSIAGQQYYWNFGDPASGAADTSTAISPVHLYTNAGTYRITLIAVDSTTCNISDTATFTVTMMGKPTAGFTYSPEPPQPPNTPTIFSDASSPGVKYQWFFGDGTSETKTTPDTVVHLYNRTDTFQACLVVTNASGCADTACHSVPAVINPLLDVPNAFTPGRFGQNAVIKVVGFGISHMDWRIYNRWGQLVFESNDPYAGWDGTYRGVVQPMDVYGYTLEVDYSDGSHASKKGDITLIR
ncbi:MAG TPA: PKD domain-containing protein [Puia sp.]|nr:PKD domain-containing protein [Puia sp.]